MKQPVVVVRRCTTCALKMYQGTRYKVPKVQGTQGTRYLLGILLGTVIVPSRYADTSVKCMHTHQQQKMHYTYITYIHTYIHTSHKVYEGNSNIL